MVDFCSLRLVGLVRLVCLGACLSSVLGLEPWSNQLPKDSCGNVNRSRTPSASGRWVCGSSLSPSVVVLCGASFCCLCLFWFCVFWLCGLFASPAPFFLPSPRSVCPLPSLSYIHWALPRPVAAGSPILSHQLTTLCGIPSSNPDLNLLLLPAFACIYFVLPRQWLFIGYSPTVGLFLG